MTIRILTGLFIFLISSAHLLAISSTKVGTVDFQKSLVTVAEGKLTKAELEKEAATMRTDLEGRAKELKKMEEEIQGLAASILSDAAKLKKGQEFQKKFMELRQEEQRITQMLQRKEQEGVQRVFRKLRIITKEIAKKKNLPFVFETNASGLIYASETIDLTDEVIVEYDRRYKTEVPKTEKK